MTEHYIDGERFTQLAREGEATPEIIEMLYALADCHYYQHAVSRFMERDDAKQEAVIRCLSIVPNFKTRVRGPAYNYFRSVVHHLFCDIVQAAGRTPVVLDFIELTDTAEDFRPSIRKRYKP